MRRHLLLITWLSLAACGPKPQVVEHPTQPTADAGALPAAAATADDLLAAQQAALAANDNAALVATWADDVLAIGPRARQVAHGRAEALVLLTGDAQLVTDAAATMTWEWRTPEATASPDGRSVWVRQELGQTVTVDGETRTQTFRVTQLLVEADGVWHVAVCHWSVAAPDREAAARGATVALPAMGSVDGTVAVDVIASGSEALVGLLDAALASHDLVRAAQLVDAGAEADVAAYYEATDMARVGSVRAALAPSGTVGYVAANIDVSSRRARAKPLPHHLRALVVFAQIDGAWQVQQVHLSYGFGED